MTVTYMEIPTRFGAKRPSLFRKSTRDALADVLRERFQFGRRSAVRSAFKLTDDQARAACRGSLSWETFDQVLDQGGWSLALDLLAARFGEGIEQHLAREAAKYAEQDERLVAITRNLWVVGPSRGDGPVGVAVQDARLAGADNSRMGARSARGNQGRGSAAPSRSFGPQLDE